MVVSAVGSEVAEAWEKLDEVGEALHMQGQLTPAISHRGYIEDCFHFKVPVSGPEG